MKTVCPLQIVTAPELAGRAIARALERGLGVVDFAVPTIVHRAFCRQGEPFGLDPRQVCPYDVIGDADELWFGSAQEAKTAPGSPAFEGISMLAGVGDDGGEVRVPFSVALDVRGGVLVGSLRVRTWPYAKYFSNLDDIPNHYHLTDAVAAQVGDEAKPESYIIFPHVNQRALRRATYMPAGLYEGATPDDIMPFLLAENWGSPEFDGRKLSPGHLIEPGQAWHMPPGVPHAPSGGRAYFELMPSADNFRMISGYQDGNRTPRSVVCRHMPAGLAPEPGQEPTIEMLRHVAESIDFEASCNPRFKQDNMLPRVPDTENNGNGVPAGAVLNWAIYGRLQGKERYSAKLGSLQPYAAITFSGPALYILVLDGMVQFGGRKLAATRLFTLGERTHFEAVKRDGDTCTVRNIGPGRADFLVSFGADSHGSAMPACPSEARS